MVRGGRGEEIKEDKRYGSWNVINRCLGQARRSRNILLRNYRPSEMPGSDGQSVFLNIPRNPQTRSQNVCTCIHSPPAINLSH